MTTEATGANLESERLSWLVQQWTVALHEAFSAIGIAGLTIDEPWDESEITDPEQLWCGQSFDFFEGPCIWIGAGKTAWQRLGGYLQRHAGIEEPDDASVLDTYREVAAQSLVALVPALAGQLGQDIACTETATGQARPENASAARLVRLQTEDGFSASLSLACSPGLLQLLNQGPDLSEPQGREPGDPAVDFESVLDLDMPVSVALGSARIDLQRTLNLAEGAVIRLGRAPSDLMQLMINGRCVAEGELVAARGQYAIRIHHVSGAERLAQVQSISGPEQKSLPSSQQK